MSTRSFVCGITLMVCACPVASGGIDSGGSGNLSLEDLVYLVEFWLSGR